MNRRLALGAALWVVTACRLMSALGAQSSEQPHAAEPPRFAAPLKVEKAAARWKITFAASGATDVEASVLDPAGNVVRHLAAGALGGRFPPPAPLGPALSQELVWDGTDDFGVSVAPAACKVRVRLGMQAALGRMLMNERGVAFAPRAATVGPDGLVYVLSEQGQVKSTFLLEAYTQAGEYVKTVMPYPANLPEERLRGLPRLKMPDGRLLPMIDRGRQESVSFDGRY